MESFGRIADSAGSVAGEMSIVGRGHNKVLGFLTWDLKMKSVWLLNPG